MLFGVVVVCFCFFSTLNHVLNNRVLFVLIIVLFFEINFVYLIKKIFFL
ncbi:hypothetical protein T190130A13A_70004 [Tenacibaculum sp. 190130A14a]